MRHSRISGTIFLSRHELGTSGGSRADNVSVGDVNYSENYQPRRGGCIEEMEEQIAEKGIRGNQSPV
jgi:hypothetical protein